MSDIRKRVALYEVSGGKVRFQDWALVNTALGTMVEPFNANNRFSVDTQIPDFDFTDAGSKIDELKEINADTFLSMLAVGGANQIHGGNLLPRVGR